jgi:hypothetical protein
MQSRGIARWAGCRCSARGGLGCGADPGRGGRGGRGGGAARMEERFVTAEGSDHWKCRGDGIFIGEMGE